MSGGSIWTVVVAGGSGLRFGGPKQFDLLAGVPVVAHSVATARRATDGVVLVVPEGRELDPACFGADVTVCGGSTRTASVRRGLGAVPGDADIVVVHDAARPLATDALFAGVLAPLLDASSRPDGVVCALDVADTLKKVAPDGLTILGTVDRDELVSVQTPQAFRADVLRTAHSSGGEATDDAGLVEAIGGVVQIVRGDPWNIKLTVHADLALLEHLLATRTPAQGSGR